MKVYFFIHPHAPASKSAYEHGIVALAEGLRKCGINFYGNINYWESIPDSGKYLIERDEGVQFSDCDVVIFSSELYNQKRLDLLPNTLFRSDRRYRLVFIDSSDIILEEKKYTTPGYSSELRNADIVLKSHFCEKFSYPDNFVPWQFGLTNRMIESVKPKLFNERQHAALVNYRSKHQLRDLAEKKFMKTVYSIYQKDCASDDLNDNRQNAQARHFWDLTGRRHYQSYYERLGSSKVCAVFGGFLQTRFSDRPALLHRMIRKMDSHINFLKYDRLLQFDSWRFWESLASGCLTIHADFDKYGIILPQMPINGTHYFGVNFANLEYSKQRFLDIDSHEAIANSGREWVLKNYSPEAVAKRLMDLLSK